MKLLAFVFSLSFVYGTSFAQSTPYYQLPSADRSGLTDVKKDQRFRLGELKGARAKNYPTHAYRSSRVVVAAPAEGTKNRMGPAAKNYRPWRDDTKAASATIIQKKKRNLKGPRAKNRKPWDNR